jgi:hypothetical protein
MRDTARCISRLPKITPGPRQSEKDSTIFLENSSWHNMNGLLRFSQKYRSMVESTVNQLDETFFDKKLVTELLNHDLNSANPRLSRLWEMILTFGLFDRKYGPNANRNALPGKMENFKIVDLTSKA